jgi:outer membrane PBP1 activator LpoA protein
MKKMEARSVSIARRVTIVIAAILLPVLLTSCGKKGQEGGSAAGEQETAQKNEDDFLDKDAKPDEHEYLVAAKPFFVAIAKQQYEEAYALLSSYAKAELQKDENFDPYFNLKIILVEEDGQLKVGYFEFLPPSMMD